MIMSSGRDTSSKTLYVPTLGLVFWVPELVPDARIFVVFGVGSFETHLVRRVAYQMEGRAISVFELFDVEDILILLHFLLSGPSLHAKHKTSTSSPIRWICLVD